VWKPTASRKPAEVLAVAPEVQISGRRAPIVGTGDFPNRLNRRVGPGFGPGLMRPLGHKPGQSQNRIEREKRMKTITRDFAPSDRYVYDFKLCTIERGWAQIDTRQDASYFGQWINPAKRQILCYCEGDITFAQLSTDAELVSEVEHIRAFHAEVGYPMTGIDPGFSEPLKAALVAAGLEAFLH
jgi:hypothetical protein